MSWINTLKNLIDAKSAYDELEKVRKHSKKIKTANINKLKWDDLKYFNNKTMNKTTIGFRETIRLSKLAEKEKFFWPKSDSTKLFFDWADTRSKYGSGSSQDKRVKKNYILALKRYQRDLEMTLGHLEESARALDKKRRNTESMRTYAGVLSDAFGTCMKIPSLGGTTQGAMFSNLSDDAAEIKGLTATLLMSLNRLQKINHGYISECKNRLKDNNPWIDWASSHKSDADTALEKNAKSQKPK